MKRKCIALMIMFFVLLIGRSDAVTLKQWVGENCLTSNIAAGQEITLKFIGNSKSAFEKWIVLSGNLSLDAAALSNSTLTFTVPSSVGNIEIRASFKDPTIESYTITFDANGGTGTMEPQSVTKNKETALWLNEFTKEGKTFTGWATSSGGAVKYKNGADIKISADTTLYAVWGEVFLATEWIDETIIAKSDITTVIFKGSHTSNSRSWNADAAGSGAIKCYLEGDTVVVVGDGGVVTANTNSSNMFSGFNSLEAIVGWEYLDTSKVTDMSYMFADCGITDLDLSELDTSKVIDMHNMFYMSSVQNLTFGGDFTTANVTDMSNMFADCYALYSVDLSSFDTRNVQDMSYMFRACSRLNGYDFDLSNFDTIRVESMRGMFAGCTELVQLDLRNFNTTKVFSMREMFVDCTNLTKLDLRSFDTVSNTHDMTYMFDGCERLEWVRVGKWFSFAGQDNSCSQVSLPNGTWYNSTSSGYSAYDIPNNIAAVYRQYNLIPQIDSIASSLPETIGKGDIREINFVDALSYDLEDTFELGEGVQGGYRDGYLEVEAPGYVSYGDKLFANLTGLETIYGLERLDTTQATSLNGMFQNCTSLTELDLRELDTSQVTNMNLMFSGCGNLYNLNLSNFDTRKVTGMNSMFADCGQLTNLDLSSFDTGNLTNMNSIFKGCTNLLNLNLSNFDTIIVQRATNAFAELPNLKRIVVSDRFDMTLLPDGNWQPYNTSGMGAQDVYIFYNQDIVDMTYQVATLDIEATRDMFGEHYKEIIEIEIVNYSSYNSYNELVDDKYKLADPTVNGTDEGAIHGIIEAVVDENGIYRGKKAVIVSEWDTGIVLPQDCTELFANLEYVEEINGLGMLDASVAENFDHMFAACRSLTSLDLSSFGPDNVSGEIYIRDMFGGCENLEILKLNNFNTSYCNDYSDIFNGIRGLKEITLGGSYTLNVLPNSPSGTWYTLPSTGSGTLTTAIGVNAPNLAY